MSRRATLTAAFVAAALLPALAGAGARPSALSPRERSAIAAAFGQVFAPGLSGAAAGRFVEHGDARLAAALRAAVRGFLSGFTQGRPALSVQVDSLRPAGRDAAAVRFTIVVRYPHSLYRERFVGAAVHVQGGWRVGWSPPASWPSSTTSSARRRRRRR